MGYNVSLEGRLSFASIADKQKFIDILENSKDFSKHYSSIEKFIENEIAYDYAENADLVYEFYDSDRRYNEQDDSFIMILKEGEIDADFVIEFVGEDGKCWRTTYNKKDKESTEDKVYLNDTIVCCKDCKYATKYEPHSNDTIRYKCGYWTAIAGNDVRILMDKTDYCSKGTRK